MMKRESLPQQSPAQRLMEYMSALRLASVPPAVIEQAQWCLLDGLGCGLFGMGQP